MKKCMNPQVIEIQKRFFEAMDLLINTGQTSGLQTFCKGYGLNRVKYSNIRTEMRNPGVAKPTNYKVIDLDALAYMCKDYGVSSEWLLFGKGAMLKHGNI